MGLKRRLAIILRSSSVLIGLTFICQIGNAAEYPNKPIRLVVSHVAGGTVDSMGRLLGQRLSEALGQPITVENKPGGAGVIGAQFVSKATPDGYTLLVSTNAPLTTNPVLYKSIGYDSKDFQPVALLGEGPALLIVRTDSPIKSIPDLVVQAKRTTGGLSAASSGNGSIGHFAITELKRALGIPLTHVPYVGGVPGAVATFTGETQIGIIDAGVSMPFLRDKRLRAIAVLGARRFSSLPDVPTFDELGVKGMDMVAWISVVAPKGTPTEIVQRLNIEINKVLADPEIRQRLLSVGIEPSSALTAQEFGAYLNSDAPKWSRWIKESGLKIE